MIHTNFASDDIYVIIVLCKMTFTATT